MPGITGTSLINARGHEVWGFRAGSLLSGLRTLGNSVRDLTLDLDHGDAPASDGVRPGGLLPTIHAIPGLWTPINGYSQIVSFLRKPRFGLTDANADNADSPGNLIVFPYDWRLSNRHTASLLKDRVEPALDRWRRSATARTDAKVIFIGHSMGGLVSRWYIEQLGGIEITRALVTLGTPHRGSVKSLENLVNGARRGPGPLKLDFTEFGRSLPSSYQLLPEYECIDDKTPHHKKLSQVSVPGLASALVKDGGAFLSALADWPSCGYEIVAITGIRQPTWTTASLAGDRIAVHDEIRDPGDGTWLDLRGDGTVPRVAAQPRGMLDSPAAPIHATQQGHGALAGDSDVLLQLERILTARPVKFRSTITDAPLGVRTEDWHRPANEVVVNVRHPTPRVLEARALSTGGIVAASAPVTFTGSPSSDECCGSANLGQLPEGAYEIEVGTPRAVPGKLDTVRTMTVVCE